MLNHKFIRTKTKQKEITIIEETLRSQKAKAQNVSGLQTFEISIR